MPFGAQGGHLCRVQKEDAVLAFVGDSGVAGGRGHGRGRLCNGLRRGCRRRRRRGRGLGRKGNAGQQESRRNQEGTERHQQGQAFIANRRSCRRHTLQRLERGSRHRQEMHRKHRQPEAHRPQQDVAPPAFAVGQPDGSRAEQDRGREGQHQPQRGVDRAAQLHPRHADIVHDRNADADDHPGPGDRSFAARHEMQQQQRDAGDQDRHKRRNQRDQRIVVKQEGQLQAQHGHEMHRPDAPAQRHGGHRDHHLAPARRQLRRAARQRQAGEPGHHRHGKRGKNQPVIMPCVEHPCPPSRHPRCPSLAAGYHPKRAWGTGLSTPPIESPCPDTVTLPHAR